MKGNNLIAVLMLALCLSLSIAHAAPQDVYIFTLSVDNGNVKVLNKQLAVGYVPNAFEGGSYVVKGNSGSLGTGHFALPSATIMEKFHDDNSIEGTYTPFKGELSVVTPAVDGAASVSLMDATGREIATIDVFDLKKSTSNLSPDMPSSSDFFDRYDFVFIILKYLAIIIVAIVLLVMLIKKLRKKKSASQ